MSISSRVSFSVLTLCLGLASACGGDDDSSGSGSCPQVSGTWTNNSGTCQVSSCTVVQNGCSLQVDCGGEIQIAGKIGSVSGESASVTLRNSSGSCTGQVDDLGAGKPPELEVSCTFDGQPCDAKLDCGSGACVEAGNDLPGGSGGASNGSGGASNGSGGDTGDGCCGPTDSCDWANDEVCDCGGEASWDAADCAGGSGGGGSGPERGPTCELGAAAVCTCLDGTDSPCVGDDAASLYDGCLSELPDAAFIYCFAGYVDAEGGINCTTAANACIPD